ncbi:hypothetical protein LCGC14_2159680 [marine sediment metagenome]|uniref:Uncharacterized protein n=1 Tax=marine sediment metagenome TaxID=412755 RepID=A0A0F9DTB4_9ZZZZ
MTNYPNRNCIICSTVFKPKNINNIVCPSYECKHTRFQQKKRIWTKENYTYIHFEDFKCPYCKSTVNRNRLDQKTCGDKECIRKRQNWLKRVKRMAA